jgi:hypothetical protein
MHDKSFCTQYASAEKRNPAVLDRERGRAEVWITTWEALVRRAEVGIWIRDGRVDEALILGSSRRRDRIEAIEHAVMDADHPDEGSVPRRSSNVRPRRSSTGMPGSGG